MKWLIAIFWLDRLTQRKSQIFWQIAQESQSMLPKLLIKLNWAIDMPSSDCIARTYQKQYKYNSSTDGKNIITLIDNKLDLVKDKIPVPDATTWVNGFIKVLTCKSVINSLPSTPFPQYLDTDTESDRLTKTQAIVWGSAAYRIVIHLSDSATSPWVERVFYNLTNSFGFPYVLTTLLDGLTTDIARDVAEGGRLGISFEDIGWGLPKANDSIVIDCVWSAEYNWVKPYDVNISQPVVVQTATVQQVVQKNDSYTNTRVGTTAVQLMAANSSRISGQIVNSSSNLIYYGLGTTPTTSVYSGTVSGGATASLPAGNKTSVSVIAATGIQNSVTASEVYNLSS